MSRPAPTWSARTRFRVATGALAAASGLVAILGSALVFPYLSQNSDEGAYLSQVGGLRAGQLIPHAPDALAQVFRPWFSVLRDGHFVFKYAPVHAAMIGWIPDRLGGTRLALGVLAAVAVVLVVALARELGAGRRGAWAAGAVFALSPVVIVQSWTYLPYLSSLTLLLAFGYAARRGARTASTGTLVIAGVVLGIAFWARPYDAVLFAAPMVVWQGLRCHQRRDPTTVARFLGLLALGAVPGMVGFLGYNALATGHPLRLPFRLQEQSDNLGFGARRTNRLEPFFEYTAKDAWRGTRENARLLLTWSFGSVMLVVLGVYGAFVRPLARSRWLLAAWLGIWPLGFYFFWGSFSYLFRWDGGRYLGPYYYLPMLVPLAIGAGLGIERALTHARWVIAVFVIGAAAIAAPLMIENIDGNLARTEHRRAITRAVDQAVDATGDRDALVLIPGVWGPHLQHPFSFLRNSAHYDGDRVYALETGNVDLAVADRYPDRTVLAMSLPDGYRDGTGPVDSPVRVERQRVARGRAVEVGITGVRSTQPLALRFALGGRTLDAPIDGTGTTRVTLTAADGGVVVTTADGTETPLEPKDRLEPLEVSIVRPLPGGGAQTLEQRQVPLAVADGTVHVMWPGTVRQTMLPDDPPSRTTRWIARTVER